MYRKTLVTGAVLSAVLVGGAPFVSSNEAQTFELTSPAEGVSQPDAPTFVLNEYAVGTPFYEGRRVGEACVANFVLEQRMTQEDGAVRVDVEHDKDCRFFVKERVHFPQREAREGGGTTLDSCSGSGAEAVYSEYWMYGYGGTWDILTDVYLELGFTWNCTAAAFSWDWGWCSANNVEFWHWEIDACRDLGHNSYSTTVIYTKANGSFHCSPPDEFPCDGSDPDGYYHTIRNNLYGYPDGTYSCLGGVEDGQIVAGTSIQCGLL